MPLGRVHEGDGALRDDDTFEELVPIPPPFCDGSERDLPELGRLGESWGAEPHLAAIWHLSRLLLDTGRGG